MHYVPTDHGEQCFVAMGASVRRRLLSVHQQRGTNWAEAHGY